MLTGGLGMKPQPLMNSFQMCVFIKSKHRLAFPCSSSSMCIVLPLWCVRFDLKCVVTHRFLWRTSPSSLGHSFSTWRRTRSGETASFLFQTPTTSTIMKTKRWVSVQSVSGDAGSRHCLTCSLSYLPVPWQTPQSQRNHQLCWLQSADIYWAIPGSDQQQPAWWGGGWEGRWERGAEPQAAINTCWSFLTGFFISLISWPGVSKKMKCLHTFFK